MTSIVLSYKKNIASDNYYNINKDKHRNILRIEKIIKKQKSFDVFMMNIIQKHDFKWINACNRKNIKPDPLNILKVIFDISFFYGKKIKPFDDFTKNIKSEIYDYKNWQFSITYDKNLVYSVYFNKKIKYRD